MVKSASPTLRTRGGPRSASAAHCPLAKFLLAPRGRGPRNSHAPSSGLPPLPGHTNESGEMVRVEHVAMRLSLFLPFLFICEDEPWKARAQYMRERERERECAPSPPLRWRHRLPTGACSDENQHVEGGRAECGILVDGERCNRRDRARWLAQLAWHASAMEEQSGEGVVSSRDWDHAPPLPRTYQNGHGLGPTTVPSAPIPSSLSHCSVRLRARVKWLPPVCDQFF